MYISLEGIDGCGKSSVLDKIAEKHPGCIVTKEPQGIFRDMVLDKDNKYGIDEMARMLLFQADRAVHIKNVVEPNWDKLILCSRGVLSTLAYQTITTGLEVDTLLNISKIASRGFMPNAILLFNVSFETAKQRMSTREKGAEDYFDRKGKDFFDALINRYRVYGEELSMKHGIPVININTEDKNLEEVVVKTQEILKNMLDKKCNGTCGY